ncbi:FxSxx-COOH cyclophane-containing RiPP peptide [Actinoplanes sp. NPDC026619]|uniref:FxSxx-COOH cyclophane-containing RiPP peptide n=1 Tax=Actinoplanes sp. NPDC026619 TaxID=3155798 RepID=UPI0033D8A37C
MTPPNATPIETGLVRVADVPLDQLLALREAGDTALGHCLRRVIERAASGKQESVAAFNAAPLRRS